MMKRVLIVVASVLASASFAASDVSPVQLAQAGPASMTQGEVRKVDKDAKKITLKHGEIVSLGMPPMTMVFRVKDEAMLDKVKTGDRIWFSAADVNGAITITAIETSR